MSSTLKANDTCWCGSGIKYKRCHKNSYSPLRQGSISETISIPDNIEKPSWADGKPKQTWKEPKVKSQDVIDRMIRTGQDAADTLVELGKLCQPGVTTDEIDIACNALALEKNSYPSPLEYPGAKTRFPKSLCTSVNEVICHGIPDDRPLQDGDIINLDVTLYKEGVHGDTNATFYVGNVDKESQLLTTVTRDCLELGIEAAQPGNKFNMIGKAIEDYAKKYNFGVVEEFVGHGIGEQFHTDLQICHYYHPYLTDIIEPGMTFTIEPMITLGSAKSKMWKDGWTAVTSDLSRTAQFEHTILIKDDGPEILTTPKDKSSHPYWNLKGT